MLKYNDKIEEIFLSENLRPTPNRLLVYKALDKSKYPMSLYEIESQIESIDKSNVLRALTSLREHHLIHTFEDGRGVTKYECCHGHGNSEDDDDIHVHFYCELCKRVICFDGIPVPKVTVPEGYKVIGTNYMIKGICAECSNSTASL